MRNNKTKSKSQYRFSGCTSFVVICFMLMFVGTGIANADIIGNWRLDEGAGTTAADSSGNTNHGTLVNMDTAPESPDFCWVDGKIGKALEFDDNDYMDCGNDASLDLAGEITIVAWMKTTYSGSHAYLIEKLMGGWGWNTGYGIFMSYGSPLLIIGTGGEGTNYHAHFTTNLADGEWHHIVFTVKDNVETKAYIDGSLYSVKAFNHTFTTNVKRLAIGGGMQSFNGAIDEVRIYSRILSANEIKAQYEQLAGKWHFDENEGETTEDSSGNTNHGTLVNMDTAPESPDFCWVDGKIGKALEFDDNDYVDCGNDAILDITGEITIEAWMKTTYNGSHAYLIEKLMGGWGWNTGYGIFMSYGSPQLIIGTGGEGTNYHPHFTTNLADGKWHYIVFTVKDNVETKAYIDGNLYSVKAFNYTLTTNVKRLAIGGGMQSFNGTMDEVRIHSRVLNGDEIYQRYLDCPALIFVLDETLEESYGYAPEYPTGGVPGFDSTNRPYIRASSSVTTLRNGFWEDRDFLNFIIDAYPDFNSTYSATGFFNDTQVVFDVDDNAYTFLAIKLNDGTIKSLLLFSTDYCMTWSVHELPGGNASYNSHAYEHPYSASITLSGPPAVLRLIKRADFPADWHEYYYRWEQAYYYIYLIQPRIESGVLVMPGEEDMIEVANSCIGWSGVHSGGASFTVTKDDKTHIIWAGVKTPSTPPNIEPEDNATPVYIRTYDHQTQTLSQPVYLFSTKSCDGISDVHNMPGICIDSEGYLHVIAAGHINPCIYVKSLVSNDANSGWTTPVEINPNGGSTYLGFVCDEDDTLHIIYRRRYYADEYHSTNYDGLCYQRKLKTSLWEFGRRMIVPAYPGYAGYYHKLAIDNSNRLFIASPGYYSIQDPRVNADYSLLLASPWWEFANTTQHFSD